MSDIVRSMHAEYRRYKAMGEAAMEQLSVEQLNQPGPGGGNSVSTVAWHIAGNFNSRFTDFLTTDGEKPWRDRESEFDPRTPTREQLIEHWERGWRTLFESLDVLTDDQLGCSVCIRSTEVSVLEALHRSLAHASYHVGQIIYAARSMRGSEWRYLTIPPGQSEAYNLNPTGERPDSHVGRLRGDK